MISIIIPTRNRPELLRRAIYSILSQSHGNFELIVVDNSDGYDPRIADLDRIEDDPGRIRYLPPGDRLPMWDNWRRGFNAARGDWILFLPDKCILAPGALHALISQQLSPEWIYTWEISYGVKPRAARAERNYQEFGVEQTFSHVRTHAELSNVFPHGMNALYPRGLLHDWFFQSSCPDYYTGCCALYKSKGVRHLSQPLTYVPRNNPLLASTGAMVALSHPGANEYLKDVHVPGGELVDPTYCWGYVEKILYLPFNFAAYLRHTLNRARAGCSVKKQVKFILANWKDFLAAAPSAFISILSQLVKRARE